MDRKDLTRRSRSSNSTDGDNEGFHEVVYPAYPVYTGYPAYLEAPGEFFAEGIPKRMHSRHSDPTLSSEDRDGIRGHKKDRRDRSDFRDNGLDNAVYTA